MANERCSGCGALIALVGRAHRCVQKSGGTVEARVLDVASRHSIEALPAATVDAVQKLGTPSSPDSTYRYRNADERRAYMRDYMKRKRAKGT